VGQMKIHERLVAHLRTLEEASPDRVLLVALSGGLDSVVLLHLLRFRLPSPRPALHAAHFDHAMRADSAGDAAWVAGLCRAWGVPLTRGRAGAALAGEESARTARYAFLKRAREEAGADFVLTAHHADDQAETVLFRVLRGTGMAGLKGIGAVDEKRRLLRPLLPFWRRELEEYASWAGLRWREDDSNLTVGPARNRIRLRILPEIERYVSPGARRSLVRLAELAAGSEAAWERIAAQVRQRAVREAGGDVELSRPELRRCDRAIALRVLREVLRGFGLVLDRAGTRAALQFITDAPSGRRLDLPGGVRIRSEFDVVRVERATTLPPDRFVVIARDDLASELRTALRLAGREYRVAARLGRAGDYAEEAAGRASVAVPTAEVRFPLRIRGRRPGDRLRTHAGTKSLKKLFIERRVPLSRRPSVPVLVDADGVVVWVGGVDATGVRAPRAAEEVLLLTLADD
jgi:tRNA(Ile)-lysidine synthase